METSASLINQ